MNGIVGAIISALGFGTANIVIKKSLSTLTIPQTLMMSTLSGAVFLALLSIVMKAQLSLTFSILMVGFLLAAAEVGLYFLLYKAFDVGNVSVATALIGTYPLLTTIFAVIALSETLPMLKYGFIGLMVMGGILTSIRWQDVLANGFDRRDLVKGLPWILAALVAHGLYFPVLGIFTAHEAWAVTLLLIKVFSAVILFCIFYLFKKQSILPPKDRVPFTSLLGLLEVTGWAGFAWATSSTEGQTAIIIAALNSLALVTAILAYFVLQEKLSFLQYVGITIIVVGLTGLSL